MKHQFSLLAFLAKVPVDVLEAYFTEVELDQTPLGACIPWDALMYDRENFRRGLAIIRQAITEAGAGLRERILQDFMDVNDLADDAGLVALAMCARLRPQSIDLWDTLYLLEGSHGKVMYVLCHWPEIFHSALRHRRVQAIAEHRWHKTGRIAEAMPNFSSDAQAQLADVIGQHYLQLGRGRGCAVDVETHGDEVYLFLYPEDYARRRLAFDKQHTLMVETVRPAFEVIFVYHTAQQTVDFFSPGNKLERQQVLKLFGRVMLGVELYPEDRRQKIFELDALKYRGFNFVTRPEDGVKSVVLKEIWLKDPEDLDYCGYHYSSELRSDPESCYNAMDKGLNQRHLKLEEMDVEAVQLRIYFRGESPSARPISRTITLTHPDVCSLKRSDPYYQVVLRLLREWGIDAAATVAEPVFRLGAA